LTYKLRDLTHGLSLKKYFQNWLKKFDGVLLFFYVCSSTTSKGLQMPAYKPPRPNFDWTRTSTQEFMKIFLSRSSELDTYQVLSAVKPASPLDAALQAFKEHTNVPLQIPLMGFLHLVGTWLLKNESVIEVQGATINPDLWTIVLAPSGSGKTFAFDQLQKASKACLNVKAEFDAPASAAAYLQELSDKNRSLWFADEFAQMLSQIEQVGSPLAQAKEYMLKTYDGNPIQRKTKADLIEIENPVLSVLGVNTLESYLNKISEESFTDGFSQRFSYLLAKADPNRSFENYPWFAVQSIQESLKAAFTSISGLTLHKRYTVGAEAFRAYQEGFKVLLKHGVSESFFRRLMYRSFKYALIFHVIHGDESSEITKDDIAWAMRLIDIHLCDLKELLAQYNYGDLAKTIRKVQEKKAEFESAGKSFSAREVVQNIKRIKTVSEAKSVLSFVQEVEEQERRQQRMKQASAQDAQFKVAA
jgi:hypothetical protein